MKKIMKNAVILFIFLVLGTATAFLTYLHFFAPEDSDLSGQWTAEVDMSQQAAVAAYNWLQDIEAVSFSLEEAEAYMQGLTVQVNMTMEQTERSKGRFSCSVIQDSYDACSRAAYEAFARAFLQLLGERLCMADYAGGTDRDAVEALVAETFGMSTVSYLMSYGPALLPSFEELQALYGGAGAYGAAGGILVRQFETGGETAVKEERYIRQDASLVLLGDPAAGSAGSSCVHAPLIYTLKPDPDQ